MKLNRIECTEGYQALCSQLAREGFSVTLSRTIEQGAARHGKTISFFFRDDDVDVPTPNLFKLLHIFVTLKIPLHLQVIPKSVTVEMARSLKNLKRKFPDLIWLSQHGWCHRNHSTGGKKYEFGDTRRETEQFLDITAGKEKMTQLFLDDFFPAFTPPWNRYNRDTLKSLKELNFEVLSADGGKIGWTEFGLAEISTAIDCYHRRPAAELKNPAHLLYELNQALDNSARVGFLLHHHEMKPDDFHFFTRFLSLLKLHDEVVFRNFKEIYRELCLLRRPLRNLKGKDL